MLKYAICLLFTINLLCGRELEHRGNLNSLSFMEVKELADRFVADFGLINYAQLNYYSDDGKGYYYFRGCSAPIVTEHQHKERGQIMLAFRVGECSKPGSPQCILGCQEIDQAIFRHMYETVKGCYPMVSNSYVNIWFMEGKAPVVIFSASQGTFWMPNDKGVDWESIRDDRVGLEISIEDVGLSIDSYIL